MNNKMDGPGRSKKKQAKRIMTTKEKLHGHWRAPGQKGFFKQFTMDNLKKDYKWAYGGGMQKSQREEDVKGSKAPTSLTKRHNKAK